MTRILHNVEQARKKVGAALDGIALGLKIQDIHDLTGCSTTLYYRLLEDFPLWKWAREHARDD